MATTAQSYGLRPVYHPSGQNRATKYNILNNAGTGYAAALYYGAPVTLATDGTIQTNDGSTNCLGVFAGCEYVDATGKPHVSKHWTASTALLAGTEVKAYVYDDPQTIFAVGVSANAASYVQAAVGDQVDLATPTAGSATTGQSSASISAAPVGAGAGPAQLRVVGFVNGEIYDATTNPFPELLVQIVQHHFNAGAGQAAI